MAGHAHSSTGRLLVGRFLDGGRMSARRVLAVGAHPDDIELGCFASVAKWQSFGADTRFLVMSDGENGSQGVVRREEAGQAAALIGAQIEFGGFPANRVGLFESPMIQFIEAALKEFEPNVILTHTSRDRHQDHRSVAGAVFSAARRRRGRILLFDTTKGIDGYEPRYFVRVDEFIPMKLKALACHRSQSARHFMNAEVVSSEAVQWGYRICGFGMYEAFELRLDVED